MASKRYARRSTTRVTWWVRSGSGSRARSTTAVLRWPGWLAPATMSPSSTRAMSKQPVPSTAHAGLSRDDAAIVDLIVSIAGRAPQQRTDALVEQVAWAGCAAVLSWRAPPLSNQLLRTLELISGRPALMTCSSPTLTGRARVISRHRREATTATWRGEPDTGHAVSHGSHARHPLGNNSPLRADLPEPVVAAGRTSWVWQVTGPTRP